MAKRLENHGVTVNAYHLGIMRTNQTHETPTQFRIIVSVMSLILGALPEHATDRFAQLASSSQFEGISGRFLNNCKTIESPFSNDVPTQETFCQVSCDLSGVSENIDDHKM